MLADQSTQLRLSVKKDILHFSRTLINVQGLDDWAWDLVAHIFRESSLHSSQMVLWPQLLEYMVPAQYSCILIPLCRCHGDLAKQPQWEGEEQTPAKEPNFLRPRGSSPMQLGVVASALGDSSTHILP
ncbi:hypothetical protein Y1Q_0006558 [Alligator mississippiensis]|uniref:MROH2B-like HEAT-repeats domain-containing protein n=1 Tax=Alligator mississippiensis TaxID=8496 RepID=A0A151NT29_ALLMI|nr:hypothetical protein Y1Q_0006558 [Alligator mississippiensis]